MTLVLTGTKKRVVRCGSGTRGRVCSRSSSERLPISIGTAMPPGGGVQRPSCPAGQDAGIRQDAAIVSSDPGPALLAADIADRRPRHRAGDPSPATRAGRATAPWGG